MFDAVQWHSGYRQGGPLSALLFVIVVAPFLYNLSELPGVRAVFGFCDDWEACIQGIRPIASVANLVAEFELASGQHIHRGKSKWLPSRNLTRQERRCLSLAWPDPQVVHTIKALGVFFGRGVTAERLLKKPFADFMNRLSIFKKNCLSFTMRIIAANVFLIPLFSFVQRVVLIP